MQSHCIHSEIYEDFTMNLKKRNFKKSWNGMRETYNGEIISIKVS